MLPIAYTNLVLPKDAPFELRPTPGKGWGAFATEAITKRSRIVLDHALFILPENNETPEGLKNELARLSHVKLKQVLSIHELMVGGDSDWAWAETMRLNSFPVKDTNDKTIGQGFFSLLARFNHSCRNNCYLPPNHYNGKLKMRASRDIAQGEELTFRYHGHTECLTKKQRELRLDFGGSICACELCTADPKTLHLSDLRRTLTRACFYVIEGSDYAALESYSVPFEDCFVDPTYQKAVQQFRLPIGKRLVYCCLALALMEAEGVLTPTLSRKPEEEIRWCARGFDNIVNKAIAMRVRNIGRKETWAEAFVEACALWPREDRGDAIASSKLQRELYRGGGSKVRTCAPPI